jgi:cation transport ATPase
LPTALPLFRVRSLLVAIAITGLVLGGAAWFLGYQDRADWVWAACTVPVLAALVVEILTSLRRGEVGLDLVAALSMTAALAFGQPLAGNVVALMYAGGQLLESYAEQRARREMTALLGRVARTAMRHVGDRLAEVAIEDLAIGDRVLVRHGEVVPVDGSLASGHALVDQSALTGEGIPVEKRAGDEILSGSTNVGDAFDLTAVRPAGESTYANIVRLVRQAQESGDPYALREGVPEGTAVVAVAVDGEIAGIIVLADRVRPDAAAMLDAFRDSGIEKVVLASGDRRDVVAAIGKELGISEVHGELDPQAKVDIVESERARAPVMMVGDGVNDAPALASADVGVAMGARGSAASSESADLVLLVDRLDTLTMAVRVAHRTRRIALESVLVGLGLSVVAMIVAAFGYLPPVAGALTQEAIDVAVILNALRALR